MDVRENLAYKQHIKSMQALAEKEKQIRQDEASEEAARLIADMPLAAGHDYLTRKQVKPYGLYLDGNALEARFGINLSKPTLLVTFHPVTLENVTHFPSQDKAL